MLADHHPVTHQKELQNTQTTPDNGQCYIERSEIRQISNSVPVNTDKPEEKCAQHTVHFIGAQDQSDAGSLTTQAPQSSSMHATINTLSTWISAVQPRESWYLAGWIRDSPIDFLVDPGAVVSVISLQCYERLVDAGSIHTPLKEMQMELEAANKSDMTVHGMCSLELSVHGLVIHIDTVVVDLNCQAILGMDILGNATKLRFILDLVDGTLSGGGYETIQLHRFHAAMECFAETSDTVCIPPHSEVMLWAKLKTNNGRRGPTAGVVLALQTFVQEFGILVGRSLVRADADGWKVPILLYNSDPCTKKSKDCKCNPVIIPARTHIARGGNSGHTEYRYSRDRTQHRRMQTSTPLNRRARRSERTHERPACAQPICWLNISTRFRPLGPRLQVERKLWCTILIPDLLDRYVVTQGNSCPRKSRYNKN